MTSSGHATNSSPATLVQTLLQLYSRKLMGCLLLRALYQVTLHLQHTVLQHELQSIQQQGLERRGVGGGVGRYLKAEHA